VMLTEFAIDEFKFHLEGLPMWMLHEMQYGFGQNAHHALFNENLKEQKQERFEHWLKLSTMCCDEMEIRTGAI
jgi:hypothetical protein